MIAPPPADGGGVGGGGDADCIAVGTAVNSYLESEPPILMSGCYARYRVNNGAWIDYVGADGYWEDEFNYLLDQIAIPELEIRGLTLFRVPLIANYNMGYVMISVDANNRTNFDPNFDESNIVNNFDLPAAFIHLKDRWTDNFIAAASASDTDASEIINEDGSYGVFTPSAIVEKQQSTTIEFTMSSGVGVDLVAAMFGDDTTIKSCGFAIWNHAA